MEEGGKVKAKYSTRDSEGRLYVDCAECEKGGNGEGVVRCGSGARITKGFKGCCFSGILKKGLKV